MDIDSPDIQLLSKRDRVYLFLKIYWRILVIISVPLLLLPVALSAESNAFKCFYVFLLMAAFWIMDVLPACVTALIPVAMMTYLGVLDSKYIGQIHIRNSMLNCFNVMIMIAAIEKCQLHKRIALKLLLVFGCSHYRLSFILFFATMFLSMWIPNTLSCGLMIPIVKAALAELEKMGILDIYLAFGKSTKRVELQDINPQPTDFTVFYFLGIAFSASIGGMATLAGSETNQLFKLYSETIFPNGLEIEFPHFMLLCLPGVLVIESLLYIWMNFYFIGMFRAQSEIALQIGMTEQESQFISTLLATQYHKLGKIKLHEIVVTCTISFAAFLRVASATVYPDDSVLNGPYREIKMFAPDILSVLILFMAPNDLEFTKFFRYSYGTDDRALPRKSSPSFLSWADVAKNIHWSVLIIIAGSTAMFESLKDSAMTGEFEKFLLLFSNWPAPALALIVIIFCKIITEFAPNATVVHCILPHVARLSVASRVHPHYLMLAATLASSLPFHLSCGTPANALVAANMHIPPWKMMSAGLGPSLIAVVITWFTVTLWSKAIWSDIVVYPPWADDNHFLKSAS